jgi:hypothetical protein
MNKNEIRRIAFNALLDMIVNLVREKDASKKSLLGLFYAFFIDTANAKKLREKAKKAKNDPARKKSETEEEEDESKAVAAELEKKLRELENTDDANDKGLEEKNTPPTKQLIVISPPENKMLQSGSLDELFDGTTDKREKFSPEEEKNMSSTDSNEQHRMLLKAQT